MDGYVNHKGSASIKKEPGFEAYYLERNRVIFSLRNDKNKLRKITAISYVFIRALAKGILKDPAYFKYISYYLDGLRNKDKYEKGRL